MWRKIRTSLTWILLLEAVVYVMGRAIERRMTRGNEETDEFKVAAICNGKDFHSHATHLRSGSVVAGVGGVNIDLRDATLDSAGATLELNALLGGIQLTVPEEWAVEFESETMAGGFQTDVTPLSELPDDSPQLHVHAVTRMGGSMVTAEP